MRRPKIIKQNTEMSSLEVINYGLSQNFKLIGDKIHTQDLDFDTISNHCVFQKFKLI